MDLKLDPESLKEIVSAAILQHLDASKREILIKDTIKFLMAPDTATYGNNKKTTPIEDAFHYASQQVAREIVEAEIKKPEVRSIIEKAVTAAFSKAMEDQMGMIDNMAKTITECFRFKERY